MTNVVLVIPTPGCIRSLTNNIYCFCYVDRSVYYEIDVHVRSVRGSAEPSSIFSLVALCHLKRVVHVKCLCKWQSESEFVWKLWPSNLILFSWTMMVGVYYIVKRYSFAMELGNMNKPNVRAISSHGAVCENYNYRACFIQLLSVSTLQWRHNGLDSISNHQPHDYLRKRLFRPRSKEISKLRVIVPCVGNSPGTGEFPAERASKAENVSIWWRHHEPRIRACMDLFGWFFGRRIHSQWFCHSSHVIVQWLPYRIITLETTHKTSLVFLVNSSSHGQNGRHFANDIFKSIFCNENLCVLIWISLKGVPKGLIVRNRILVKFS